MNYTLYKILLGTTMIGITAGLLGVFTFLRRQSLLGDAISHAALPGVATMFLATHSNNPFMLFIGGFIAGIIGTLFVNMICSMTRLKRDAALGIVLSVFFGLGLVLLTIIQKIPVGGQVFLHRFLFGDASTLLDIDIYFIALMSLISCGITLLCWKEFKVLAFDPAHAMSCGYSVFVIESLLTIVLVSSIVVGLQMVGVILMSALYIASAVAARQLTHNMELMTLFSALCGGISCAFGSLASCVFDDLPTGPAIVLTASLLVVLAFIINAAITSLRRMLA